MDIVEITKSLGPAVSTLAIVLATFVTSFKIYLQYKEKLAEKEPSQDAFRAQQAPQSLDNLAELLVQNFRILNSFYSESLSQYRTSSIASISIAVLGFVVIIAGVLIALIGNQVTFGCRQLCGGYCRRGSGGFVFSTKPHFSRADGRIFEETRVGPIFDDLHSTRERSERRR